MVRDEGGIFLTIGDWILLVVTVTAIIITIKCLIDIYRYR